jgi:hypothetical protein
MCQSTIRRSTKKKLTTSQNLSWLKVCPVFPRPDDRRRPLPLSGAERFSQAKTPAYNKQDISFPDVI